MKYYLGKIGFIFIYIVLCTFIALGAIAISNSKILGLVLCILNFLIYALVVCITGFQTGAEAMQIQINNDIQRKQIILTGEDLPLKLTQEYKVWKGFLIGILSCGLLLVLLLVHTIVILATGATIISVGGIANLIFTLFYGMFSIFMDATAYTTYFNLIFVVLQSILYGVSYIIGGKKVVKEKQEIKRQQKEIYGE